MSVNFTLSNSGSEFNLSNASATKVLIACGVYASCEDLVGEMSIEAARMGASVLDGDLAVFFTEERTEGFVNWQGLNCRFINAGYDTERLARYAKALRTLADEAEATGSKILFS